MGDDVVLTDSWEALSIVAGKPSDLEASHQKKEVKMGSDHDVVERHNKEYAKRWYRDHRSPHDTDIGRLYGCFFNMTIPVALWVFGQYFRSDYARPVSAITGLVLALAVCGLSVVASEYLRHTEHTLKSDARIVGFEQALAFFTLWLSAALLAVVIYQSRSDWQIDATEVAIPLFGLSVIFTLIQGFRNRL